MRKHRATFVFGFIGFFCLATACGDDDGGTPSGNEAGESGAGAGSSSGGNDSGGKSATAGSSGATSSNGGEPMGNGGQGANGAGKAGAGGESSGGDASGGNGGEPSGQGGAAAGAGGADDSGSVACTPITVAAFDQAQVEKGYAVYATSFTPNLLTVAADNFRLAIESAFEGPYDGHRTGTFDLTQNGDDNYKTCSRCILVYADGGQKVFYASKGTLVIAPGSKQLGGTIDATVTNLKLVEVTIAGDLTSTPVPDGACLTVASAAIKVEAPACGGFECDSGYCVTNAAYECDEEIDCPDDSDEFPANPSCEPVWTCQSDWYDDGDCDCGCGIQDVDCAGTANESECEFCVACQGNTTGGCADNQVDPANTTQCL
jgi:hypothetical protein